MTTMIIRSLDANGDWTFGAGLSNFSQNDQAINLNIKTRLAEWLNNCFWNLTAGIDWPLRFGMGQESNLTSDLQQVILQSYGVVGITALASSFNPETRIFQVSYTIDTIFSKSVVNTLNQSVGIVS